jgi:superfamily II DNA or RNA helicase
MGLLTTRLSSYFSAATRSKGNNYYYRRLVDIVDGDDYSAVAMVSGGSYYDVDLSVENLTLLVSCTCPHFEAAYCKHIWATMLAAESEGLLEAARGVRVIARRLGNRLDSTIAEKRLEPPAWKQQFETLGRSLKESRTHNPEPPSAQRQIFYLIDVTDSLQHGVLALQIAIRDLKANGEWGKIRTQGVPTIHYRAVPDPADRQILSQIAGAKQQYYYPYSFDDSVPQSCRMFPPLDRTLIPMMCSTGRCCLRLTQQGTDDMPVLEWDDGDQWEFWLEVARDEAAGRFVVSGILKRGDERMSLSDPALLTAGGMVFTRERAALLDDSGAFEWIAHLRRNGRLEVPLEHKKELIEQLLLMPRLPKLDLAEDLRFREESIAPLPRLKIRKADVGRYRQPSSLQGDLSFDYAGEVVAANEEKRGVFLAEENRYILRHAPSEREFGERLITVGFRHTQVYSASGPRSILELTPGKLPRVVRDLIGEGWHVEAEGKLYRSAGGFRLEVSSGIDWFELHGTVDFGGTTAALPQLLAALRRGEDSVPLGDGTFGLLPEDWLKKYGLLAGFGSPEDDHVRFSRGQVGLLDALLASQPEVTFDSAFARVREELQEFEGIGAEDPPAGFVGQLRGYQRKGLAWLYFLQRFGFGGCLADCMGLGKTIMALALLESRREQRAAETARGNGAPKGRGRKGSKPRTGTPGPSGLQPSLLVVPRSLVFNWKQESARFTPGLRILDHTGPERGKTCDHFHDHDVIITTYGTLRRDALQFKDFQFDYVILDETQAIKNANTESAKAVRLLRGSHRLALSGTPVENHLGELWSLFEFLNPGLLGTAAVFKLTVGARNPDVESRALLSKALRPFILRRTKEQVAKDLPAKLEQTIYCEMEPEQRKLYDELRHHYRQALLGIIDKKGIKQSKIQILEALLRLRQAACHPGLIDKSRAVDPSAKLDVLLPQLAELMEEGHKALVFSQFTSLLSIVRSRLDDEHIVYEYLDGRTRDRGARVDRFQNDPDCKLFLVSLKAGGLGLNLTAAEYVFLLDPWWNPAVESQAIDRAHRIGQTRQVFAYRLIARDTVEEKVLELQKTKKDLADSIINADNSLIRDLDREDLELLLS